MGRVEGKVALVTGAAAGLGKILEKGWDKFFAHKKVDKRPIYGHLAYL